MCHSQEQNSASGEQRTEVRRKWGRCSRGSGVRAVLTGRCGLEQGGQGDGVTETWPGCRSGHICRRGVATSVQTAQLRQHLLRTYCACGGTVDSERRPCLTAVGRENSPEDANHDSSMQHPPVTPRGVCASTLGAPRGRELEHVQHVTRCRASQHS